MMDDDIRDAIMKRLRSISPKCDDELHDQAADALDALAQENAAMMKQIEASQQRRQDIADLADLAADVCELGVVPWAHTDITNDEAERRLAALKKHPLVNAVANLRAAALAPRTEE